jgi:hypothetical protein
MAIVNELKTNARNVIYWEQFSVGWAISNTQNISTAMNDAWVLTRDKLNRPTASPTPAPPPTPAPTPTPVPPTPPTPTPSGKPRISAPLTGNIQPGNWSGFTLTNGPVLPSGQQMHFAYLLPANYDPQFVYPLLVHMHENSEGDSWYNGSNRSEYIPSACGADGWYNQDTTWRTKYPCIIICPYCDQSVDPTGGANANFGGWVPQGDTSPTAIGIHGQGNEAAVVAGVQYMQQNFSVDPTRIYATGDSLGGIGAWALLYDYNTVNGAEGHVFAAGLPFAGVLEYNGYNPATQEQANFVAQFPVFAVSGSGDTTSRVQDWNQPVWQHLTGNSNYPGYPGARAGTSNFWYLEDPNLGHDVWDTYRPLPNGQPLYDWLFSQTGNGTRVAPTPSPTPSANESPNGTKVISIGPSVIDSLGEVFAINTALQITVNGIVDTTTANVVELYYYNHTVYQKNSANNWYSKTQASAVWQGPIVAPAGG